MKLSHILISVFAIAGLFRRGSVREGWSLVSAAHSALFCSQHRWARKCWLNEGVNKTENKWALKVKDQEACK